MRKTLAILAWAAIPALISISACNGNTGGSSGVGAHAKRARRFAARPRSSQRQQPERPPRGGSTFAAYAYNEGDQPTGLYTDLKPRPRRDRYSPRERKQTFGNSDNVYYCETGSGMAVKSSRCP